MTNLAEKPKTARTSCKGCYFQQMMTDMMPGSLPRQVGCYLGRIELLAEQSAKIIEAYDCEEEFYVIEDRYCTAFRPKQWGADQKYDDNKKRLWHEIRYFPDAIIYCNKSSTKTDIIKTYRSISCHDDSCKHIYIVLDDLDINVIELEKELAEISLKQKFNITKVFGANGHKGKAIDIVYNKLTSNYFIVIDAGSLLPTDYYDTFDARLNLYLERVVFDIQDGIWSIQRLAYQSLFMGLDDMTVPFDDLVNKYPNGLVL